MIEDITKSFWMIPFINFNYSMKWFYFSTRQGLAAMSVL